MRSPAPATGIARRPRRRGMSRGSRPTTTAASPSPSRTSAARSTARRSPWSRSRATAACRSWAIASPSGSAAAPAPTSTRSTCRPPAAASGNQALFSDAKLAAPWGRGSTMEEDRDKPGSEGRRAFLKGAGATLAIAGAAVPAAPVAAQTPARDSAAAAAPAAGYQSLGLEEAASTEALVEHMWPADHLTPSGVELGIATYIDRQLAGAFGRGDRLYMNGPYRKGKAQHGYQLPLAPEARYKAGIAALNAWCIATHKRTFDRLDATEREAAL